MECLINHLGVEALSGDFPPDTVDQFPTDDYAYAFCVGCGGSLCNTCMGNKFFPSLIDQVRTHHAWTHWLCMLHCNRHTVVMLPFDMLLAKCRAFEHRV